MELKGRKLKKLIKEMVAGRGGAEVMELVEQGFVGFLDDSGSISDFEALAFE